jgi:hypothetical protein
MTTNAARIACIKTAQVRSNAINITKGAAARIIRDCGAEHTDALVAELVAVGKKRDARTASKAVAS